MLQICDDCTTAYSPGAPACPHCGSTAHHDQGDDMPKTTKARGATHGGPHADEPEPAETAEKPPAKKAAAKKAAAKEAEK